jgi:eukaryotic-like serine/threonine-protein kinase
MMRSSAQGAMKYSLQPDATLAHYRIVSVIGAGGMGEVYLAEDTKLRRKVALKVLAADFTRNEDRLRRFEQEAQAASALNHPNILTIHEIGSDADAHFIATEFIEGETLRHRIVRSGMTIRDVLEIAGQVAGALAAAHSAGIVHRDIKPENVMIRPDGYIKVLDFGLAKLTEEKTVETNTEALTIARANTDPGTVMGTLSYMSPEQARGKAVDARSDVFSLGVVIYEMIAGRTPFEGETPSDVISFILQTEPPPLTRFSPDVPSELERIVTKALAKDKEERYQTIKDMLIDLKRLKRSYEVETGVDRSLSPDSIRPVTRGEVSNAVKAGSGVSSVRTTSSAEYLLSEVRRHKLGAAAILAVLLVLLAVVIYIGFFTGSSKAIDSIAVLPLVNASNDPSVEYLSDGIAESIINSLSQFPNLKVMSRGSVFRYKGREVDPQTVGNELSVRAVLAGRLVQRGDSLSVNVELVDTRDNSQIWGQQYKRNLADVFAVQEDIAKEVSEKLRLRLSGAEKQQVTKRYTENIKAYQNYMQGRGPGDRRTRESLIVAIGYYEKAIEEDRNYPLAYSGLSESYTSLGVSQYIAPIEGRRKAEENALKAISLDENLAEGHASLGRCYTAFAPYDFVKGDRELRRAVELSPGLALAHQYLALSLIRQGHFDEGLEAILKARERDPLSSMIARSVGHPYYLRKDYARALDIVKRANELGPSFSTTWEVGVYAQTKQFDDALRQLEKEKAGRANDPILIYSTGMIYAAQGRRAEALQIINQLEQLSGTGVSQANYIAKIYGALGDKESALTWLNRGIESGALGAFYREEYVWDALRGDPRFQELLRQCGFSQ